MVAVLFKAGDHVPVIALFEVVGKADIAAPVQIAATGVNVGVVPGFTVMVIVAEDMHTPEIGVKVYLVVSKLFKAGDHVPAIPLLEVVGKAAKVAPEQIGATCVNVGIADGLTVTVIKPKRTHCPSSAVKVYVVVSVLFTSGIQVPVNPLLDVVGKTKFSPEQIGATCVNVGAILGFTVTVMVAAVAH